MAWEAPRGGSSDAVGEGRDASNSAVFQVEGELYELSERKTALLAEALQSRASARRMNYGDPVALGMAHLMQEAMIRGRTHPIILEGEAADVVSGELARMLDADDLDAGPTRALVAALRTLLEARQR